jgi:hypothetical protein
MSQRISTITATVIDTTEEGFSLNGISCCSPYDTISVQDKDSRFILNTSYGFYAFGAVTFNNRVGDCFGILIGFTSLGHAGPGPHTFSSIFFPPAGSNFERASTIFGLFMISTDTTIIHMELAARPSITKEERLCVTSQ